MVLVEYIHGVLIDMDKAKKYGARLLNLVINLFVFIVCAIVLTLMLFIAVWMRLRQARQ